MWESCSPGEIKADSESIGFIRHGSPEPTRGDQATDKGKDPKSGRRTVDGERQALAEDDGS